MRKGAGPKVARAAAAAAATVKTRHLGLLLFSRGGTATVSSPRELTESGEKRAAASPFSPASPKPRQKLAQTSYG